MKDIFFKYLVFSFLCLDIVTQIFVLICIELAEEKFATSTLNLLLCTRQRVIQLDVIRIENGGRDLAQ